MEGEDKTSRKHDDLVTKASRELASGMYEDPRDQEYYESTQKGFSFNSSEREKEPSTSWKIDEDLSDLDYYERKQTGFSFSETEGSTVSALRPTGSYELLQCDDEFSEPAINKPKISIIPTFANVSIADTMEAIHDSVLKERQSRQRVPSIARIIHHMIRGLDYNLHFFKGKDEKFKLLESAIETHDGNVILKVVLFIRNTLKKSIFQREIIKYPDAVNTYLSYLEQDHEMDELANMLLLLDKPEEAAILKYGAIASVKNLEKKGKLIDNCLNTHFQAGQVSNYLRESVLEHKICLAEHYVLKEHQTTLNGADDSVMNLLFQELTGKESFLGSSVLRALVFSCLHFYEVQPIAFISPHALKARFKLSQKQFSWCVLRALAAQQKWLEISELFLTKSWIGGTKLKAPIAIVEFLEVLESKGAPEQVKEAYVSCLESQKDRLFFGKQFKCHNTVLQILKKNKDRLGLMEYIGTLKPHSAEFFAARHILNQSGMKWQN